EVALDAPKWPIRVEERGIVPAFAVRAVVRREEDHRAIGDLELIELVEHSPDVAVQPRDHRSEALLRFSPALLLELAELGHLHASAPGLVVGARKREREIEEKRLVAVTLDERERLLRDEIVAVRHAAPRHALAVLALVGHLVRKRHALLAAD